MIIDNAQAQGARYNGQRVGGIADIECHSFYPNKNLGAYGEAGAITTNDANLADRIGVLRNYGSRIRFHNEIQGYNSRIEELQAAFLRVKLRHLDTWNTRRTEIADQYQNQLQENCIYPQYNLPVLPATLPWVTHVWHLFVIRHQKRDALQKHLADQGIQTIIHYPTPPRLSEAYSRSRFKKGDFPIAENIATTALSLPIGPHLSPPDRQSVVETPRRATLLS